MYDFELLNKRLAENSENTEKALEAFYADKNTSGALIQIRDAQTYSLLGGGKRIRPFLVNEVCRMLGGDENVSMPFAMAVEMIHTYSLIHDDLPCMDNDDLRRGKPSNHKVYGEAFALLAGDALLTNAFSAVAQSNLSPEQKAEGIAMIAFAAGDMGMIGGQVKDLYSEDKDIAFDELLSLHELKTGRMIELSAGLGALAAGYKKGSAEFEAVVLYASKIGLAFQAVDDLLDVLGDEKTVGKTLCSDKDNGKTTFLTFFDVDVVRKYATKLTEEAVEAVSRIDNSDMLKALAVYLLNRNK